MVTTRGQEQAQQRQQPRRRAGLARSGRRAVALSAGPSRDELTREQQEWEVLQRQEAAEEQRERRQAALEERRKKTRQREENWRAYLERTANFHASLRNEQPPPPPPPLPPLPPAPRQEQLPKKRKQVVRFTDAEDDALRRGCEEFGEGNWAAVLKWDREGAAAFHPSRNNVSLKDRYRWLMQQRQQREQREAAQEQQKEPRVELPWTPPEVSKLQQLTRKHGVGNWRLIAEEGRAVFLDRRTNGDLANKYRSMTLKAQRRARRQAAAAAAAAAEAAAAPASAAAAAVAGGLPWYQLTPQQRPRAERGDSDGVQPRRLEYGWLEGDAEA